MSKYINKLSIFIAIVIILALIVATFSVFNLTAFAEESHGYFTAEQ